MIEQLYSAYYKELCSWLASMTQNAAVTEDIVQETYLRAMMNAQLLETLQSKQQRAWLYRTAKNLYVDKMRRSVFETMTETMPEKAEESAAYSEIDCEQLLSFLPKAERILFLMRYFHGYNAAEIGELLHLPPGTVRFRLSSARKRLRHLWKNEN